MNASVCEGIRNRKVTRFYYDGGSRTVEPHCHGVSTANNEVLRAWETGGFSRSGKPMGWRMFTIDNMSDIVVTDEVFLANRPDYTPDDSGMSTICCCV